MNTRLDEARAAATAARDALDRARSDQADAAREVGRRKASASLLRADHPRRATETPEEALHAGREADRLEAEAAALAPRVHALDEAARLAAQADERARAGLDQMVRRVAALATADLPAMAADVATARRELAEAQHRHDTLIDRERRMVAEVDAIGDPLLHELVSALGGDEGHRAAALMDLRRRLQVRADAA